MVQRSGSSSNIVIDMFQSNDTHHYVWWLWLGHIHKHGHEKGAVWPMTWLQNSTLCWFPHVVAAVMWHDVRGCWCYASLQHKAGYYGTTCPSHLVRRLASCPVNHCSNTGRLVSACPAYVSQSPLLTSVFGNSHVPHLYLYLYVHDEQRLCSVTDRPTGLWEKTSLRVWLNFWTISTVTNQLTTSLDSKRKPWCHIFAFFRNTGPNTLEPQKVQDILTAKESSSQILNCIFN